jgi:hypothetical protein
MSKRNSAYKFTLTGGVVDDGTADGCHPPLCPMYHGAAPCNITVPHLCGSFLDSTVVVVTMKIEDTNAIKKMPGLATGQSNTYIAFTSNMISDMNLYDSTFTAVNRLDRQNKVMAKDASNAVRVSKFTDDKTPPVLLEFDFNYETEVVTFVFLETINASSLVPTQIVFRNDAPGSFTSEYRLTGGEWQSSDAFDSTILHLNLTFTDLNEIKNITNLATSTSDTHAFIQAGGVTDMNGNSNVDMSVDVSTICSGTLDCPYSLDVDLTPDITPPTVEQVDLDMDAGVLTIRFSETVNPTTLKVYQIALQADQTAPATGDQTHTLTGADKKVVHNFTTISVYLTHSDMNEIKRKRALATGPSTTFMEISGGAIFDMNNNALVNVSDANALQATH